MPDPASSFLKGGLSILSMPASNQQHTKQVTNCDSQSFSVISEFTQTPFVKDYSPSFMLFGVFVQLLVQQITHVPYVYCVSYILDGMNDSCSFLLSKLMLTKLHDSMTKLLRSQATL